MEIVPYKPGDEKHILELFEVCFKKKLSMDYWQWRFYQNPCEKKMIMLMWDQDKLIGHYALSPVKMLFDKSSLLSGLSMTTMTHPDYSGKGIFPKLANELYEFHFKNDQMSFVWGYPNMNSHYGFIKNLGWKDVVQIPTLTIDISHLKLEDQPEVEVNNTLSKPNMDAIDECTAGYSLKVDKSIPYLEWRYFHIPNSPYTKFSIEKNGIKYFVVAKPFSATSDNSTAEIDLVEIFLPNDPTLIEKVIKKIGYWFGQNRKVTKLNSWVPLSDPLHIQFEKIGFQNSLPITFMGVKWMHQMQKQVEPNHWHFSMGDSDVY